MTTREVTWFTGPVSIMFENCNLQGGNSSMSLGFTNLRSALPACELPSGRAAETEADVEPHLKA